MFRRRIQIRFVLPLQTQLGVRLGLFVSNGSTLSLVCAVVFFSSAILRMQWWATFFPTSGDSLCICLPLWPLIHLSGFSPAHQYWEWIRMSACMQEVEWSSKPPPSFQAVIKPLQSGGSILTSDDPQPHLSSLCHFFWLELLYNTILFISHRRHWLIMSLWNNQDSFVVRSETFSLAVFESCVSDLWSVWSPFSFSAPV